MNVRVKGSERQCSGTKYHRHIVPLPNGMFDIYAVLDAFDVKCPARQHAIKKLLLAGLRSKGSEIQDLEEAMDAVRRAIEMSQASGGGKEGSNGDTAPASLREMFECDDPEISLRERFEHRRDRRSQVESLANTINDAAERILRKRRRSLDEGKKDAAQPRGTVDKAAVSLRNRFVIVEPMDEEEKDFAKECQKQIEEMIGKVQQAPEPKLQEVIIVVERRPSCTFS